MSRTRFGARHASTANCSSSGLRSHSRASPSTWSNDGGHPARNGEPSCGTTRRTLPPSPCSLWLLRERPGSTPFLSSIVSPSPSRPGVSSFVDRKRFSLGRLFLKRTTIVYPLFHDCRSFEYDHATRRDRDT